MKTLFTLIVGCSFLITTINPAFAQVELWGTANTGGDYGLGCVFKTNYNGNDQQVIHSFPSPYPGREPYGQMTQASNGKFYGYTSGGGTCGYGTLFEYDIVSGTYIVCVNFDYHTKGAYVNGHPVQVSGKLYGVTSAGGAADAGTLFEYDFSSQAFSVLSDFSTLDFGTNFAGSLVQASNGKLYGLGSGGTGGGGVIYEFDPIVGTPVKLYDFPATFVDGYETWGGLIQATNGKLYGMTAYGGVNDLGVVFEYDISSSTFIKKFDLTNATGRYPLSTLMQASNGLIYGLTSEGGTGDGTLFEYDPVANTLVSRIDFDGTLGGHPAYGFMCEAPNGNLYGLTTDGGNDYMGSLFEYNPATQASALKVSFDGINGGYPSGSLVLALNGKMYGLTVGGGIRGEGNLFEYDYVTDSLTPLLDMNVAPSGGLPAGGLTLAPNGKLYGITQTGGAQNMAVIYEIDPVNGAYNIAAEFDTSNGGYSVMYGSPPLMVSELCLASNGKFYGVTPFGGANSNGALFEFDPASQVITKKATFSNIATGNRPGPGLMQASNGKLYGVSVFGGANNKGTLFSYDITGNTLTKLFDFDDTNGAYQGSILKEVAPGRLYGVTTGGGSNGQGVIYVHDITSGSTVKTVDMSTSTGIGRGTLFPASNGLLYGMMTQGGINGQGTLYTYDTTSQTITKLIDFDGSNAISDVVPGHLTEVAGGKLFAMRKFAGDDANGDLFEFDMTANTYTRKIEFGCTTGIRSLTTSLAVVNTESGSLVWPGDCNFDLKVDNTDFLWTGLAFGDSGPVRAGATNNWIGQPSTAWANTFNNSVNHKHSDSNGDGSVNMSDSVAISLNYGLTHPFRFSNPAPSVVTADIKLIATSAAIAPGSAVDFDIYLADAATPLDSLYGIAFSLDFDPALVNALQTTVTWSPSVLGTLGTNMESFVKYFSASGRIETAISRTDHINMANVYGVIGRLHLVASASVSIITNLVVSPSDVTGITTGEQQLSFNTLSDSVVVDPALIWIAENDNVRGIYVYPNPAGSWLQIRSGNNRITEIAITDTRGALVYKSNPVQEAIEIPVSLLSEGIYFIKLVTDHGTVHRKVIVSRD